MWKPCFYGICTRKHKIYSITSFYLVFSEWSSCRNNLATVLLLYTTLPVTVDNAAQWLTGSNPFTDKIWNVCLDSVFQWKEKWNDWCPSIFWYLFFFLTPMVFVLPWWMPNPLLFFVPTGQLHSEHPLLLGLLYRSHILQVHNPLRIQSVCPSWHEGFLSHTFINAIFNSVESSEWCMDSLIIRPKLTNHTMHTD